MNRIFTLFLVFIYIMACNTVKNSEQGQNLKRVWMLTGFQSFEKDYLIQKAAYLDLTNTESASSKMGCNQMSFPYEVKTESEITFSSGMSTKMYCEDMKLEDQFSKEITSVKSYLVDGHKLTLTTKNGAKITFVAQDWD